MSLLQIQLTLSGRPLARCDVAVEGLPARLTTDERGCLLVELPPGKHKGEVVLEGQNLPFGLVSAAGLRQVRVDLREEEKPIDDPSVLAAMPGERYVPLRLLGRGGAGAVFKCRDTSLDRLVAIKLMNSDFGATEEERRAFLDEARSLAQVEHPSLIQVYDVGMHQGRPYLVIQYVDGPNLDQVLRANGPLQPAHVAAVGVQMASGVAALHEAGLVHRDIKPSNGLVDRAGRVRLADFGLVRSIADMADPRSRVYGTPAYMSPEQLQGRALGPATDVFSLGASLFELATGSQPFHGVDLVARLALDPPDLEERKPEMPPELCDALRGMMAREADSRLLPAEVAEILRPLAATITAAGGEAYLPRLVTPDGGVPPTTSRSGSRRVTTGRTTPNTPARSKPGVRRSAMGGLAAQTLENLAKAEPSRMPIWMPVVLAALSAVVATILVIATTAGDDEPPPAAGTEQTAAGAEGGQGGFQITGTFEPARAEPAPEGLVERPRAMMPRGDGIGQRMFDVLGTVRAVWQRDADRRAIGAAEGVRGGARHVADDVAPAPGPRRDQGSELRDERRREERAGRREDREARGEEPEVRPEPLTERAEPRATVAPRIEVPAVAPEVAAPAVNEPAVVVPPRREPEAGAAEGTEPSRPNRPASPVEEESEEEEVRPPVSF